MEFCFLFCREEQLKELCARRTNQSLSTEVTGGVEKKEHLLRNPVLPCIESSVAPRQVLEKLKVLFRVPFFMTSFALATNALFGQWNP